MSLSSRLQPFSFQTYAAARKRPSLSIACVNVLCVALGLYMLGSRFLTVPGVLLEMPIISAQQAQNMPISGVITIIQPSLLLLDNTICSLESLPAALSLNPSASRAVDVMLLKVHSGVDVNTLMQVFDCLQAAGYRSIHLAADTLKTH